MTKERDYQELYDRLLEEVSTLHRNNRRRIRVGMRMLLAVTLGLMLLMFLAEGNKVFTLMLWILSMFAVAAYLIAVEYADYELQKKLENITQMEQKSLGTLLELPELPKVPRMGLLLRHSTREEQETPETEPVPEETAAAAEDISAEPAEETPVTKAPAAPEPEAYSVDEILREVHGGAPQADSAPTPAAPVYSGARVLERLLDDPEKLAQINAKFEGVYYPKGAFAPQPGLSRDEAKEQLYPLFRQTYAAREQEFGAERMREIERIILLRVVDEYWMDNIDAMEDLKQGIRLRAYGQTDPVVAYKREGFAMFDGMINAIREETVRRLYLFRLRTEEDIRRKQVAKITATGGAADKTVKQQPVKKIKIGANDPCPCGSGKKYKYCCRDKDEAKS